MTVDTSTDTVFFGTGSATPLYFPSVRPGPNPRTDSLIAVDLKTGLTKWWQQLISGNQWSYDVAQPPLVYDGKVGGKTHHVVSVATMEGVWFAFDADTGKPFYQRVKVIDRVEHPSLQPGPARHRLPVVDRWPQLLARLVRPGDQLRLQRRRGDCGAARPDAADAGRRRRDKFVLGDVFLGVQNGNFGTELAGLARPRLDQRDRRRDRPARVEVRRRRSPSAAA